MSALFWFIIFAHSVLLINAMANALHFGLSSSSTGDYSGSLPFVSVLVPARNEELNLPRLLQSFLAQDHPNAELIVYDDLSEDRTWDIILQAQNGRIRGIKGEDVPDGWLGKTNGCFQLSQAAQGDIWLFLDADTEFMRPTSLRAMCERFEQRPPSTILTGMTLLKGRGQIIVTMVGNMILSTMPWWLGKKVPMSLLSGVNGQCWMISKDEYRRLEPHIEVREEVLEDIMIGRYLHRSGIVPLLDDVRDDVAVYMYADFADAWRGFQKNTAFMLGRNWVTSMLSLAIFTMIFLGAPLLWPAFFLSLYLLKAITDRVTHQSWLITLAAPISFFLSVLLGLDSIFSRASGNTIWKGRRV